MTPPPLRAGRPVWLDAEQAQPARYATLRGHLEQWQGVSSADHRLFAFTRRRWVGGRKTTWRIWPRFCAS